MRKQARKTMTCKKASPKSDLTPKKFQLDIYLKGLQGVLKETRSKLENHISFADDDEWFDAVAAQELCRDLEDCISACIYAKRLAKAIARPSTTYDAEVEDECVPAKKPRKRPTMKVKLVEDDDGAGLMSEEE